MGVKCWNLSVGIHAVCCSKMGQKELHSTALNVREKERRKINILQDVSSLMFIGPCIIVKTEE